MKILDRNLKIFMRTTSIIEVLKVLKEKYVEVKQNNGSILYIRFAFGT